MQKAVYFLLFPLITLMILTGCSSQSVDYYHRIQPVPKESGFHMEGWFVWGGSPIQVDDTYYLFASRWPDSTGFPQGYRTHSEIVLATADNPIGPYHFRKVIIGEREPGYWDSGMAHNPTVHKIGDQYVLFYIGSDEGSSDRQIGYATAPDVTGPWTRSEQPIDFGQDANNPAVYAEPDGSVKMMWRSKDLQVFLATAPSFSGPYAIQNDNVWPDARLEDFYLFKRGGLYHMVCEDNQGEVTGHDRWGAHFVSDDGIHDWRPAELEVFYDHTIRWDDGTVLHCERRERPQLLVDAGGKVEYLFTSVLSQGKTWCQVVPLEK